MPYLRSRNRAFLVLLGLVGALWLAPAASATALSTVVEVGESAGSITPATVTGVAGDTFQIHNAGSHASDPNVAHYSIAMQDGTGMASVAGQPCVTSGDCSIIDGDTATVTILSPGTFTIERWTFGAGNTMIGTLTVAAPAATPATTVTTATGPCASSNWNFGVVDYSQTGFGDQILVTWSLPTVCSGTVASFVLRQTTPDGVTKDVPAAACLPDLVVSAGAASGTWSCAFKVASVPASTLQFQVVATTTTKLQATSRTVQWERGAAPNADVSFPGAVCKVGSCPPYPGLDGNPNLVYFIVSLVMQTEYASNGNSALTDKQARELLNVGVAFSDTQTVRRGRAAKATWVSIGAKTVKVKKPGKLTVALPLSKKGTALLRKGPLKVRVTYTLTRGTATRTIVQYTTLPRVAS